MTWTPGRERVWKVFVAAGIVSLVAFPLVAIFAGQTASSVDIGVVFGSALVVSVFCYGVTRIAALLAAAGAVAVLAGFALRPSHLPWWAFSVLAVAGTWAWTGVQRRQRARAARTAPNPEIPAWVKH